MAYSKGPQDALCLWPLCINLLAKLKNQLYILLEAFKTVFAMAILRNKYLRCAHDAETS